MEKTAEFYLRVENFKPEMILENRLSEMMSGAPPSKTMADTVRPFVERLASADPLPGGGSASALAGAMGAALGQMAIRITKDKKKYSQYADRYTDALDRLAPYTATLLELIDADSEAYSRVMSAYQLPKDSPEREKAVQAGLIRATEIPSRTANCAAEALRVLEPLRSIIHVNVASDLQVGMQMLRSCLRGAIANMQTNLTHIKDSDARARYEDMITLWEQTLRGN
jgi:formiminotetrahydrofolate cyclodeaminase